jgi:hypothetical protein
VLGAESDDELLVSLLLAALVQDSASGSVSVCVASIDPGYSFGGVFANVLFSRHSRHLVLGAESDDELLVSLLLAALVQDTHVSLTAVEGLGGLTDPLSPPPRRSRFLPMPAAARCPSWTPSRVFCASP